jgi:hypothetical protein
MLECMERPYYGIRRCQVALLIDKWSHLRHVELLMKPYEGLLNPYEAFTLTLHEAFNRFRGWL